MPPSGNGPSASPSTTWTGFTTPSPALFYDDADYTPEGRLHWTAERYERKIRNTAAVIDSMALPLVALWGVENEQVVRDIAAACRGEYSYLHRTLNSLDGMDFALLYYGDLFYPTYDEPGRRYLYVEGELGHDTVGLALCGDARMARWVVKDLRAERPHAKLIVLGRSDLPRPRTLGTARCDPARRTGRTGHHTARRTVADARPHPRGHGADNLGGRRFRAPLSG